MFKLMDKKHDRAFTQIVFAKLALWDSIIEPTWQKVQDSQV